MQEYFPDSSATSMKQLLLLALVLPLRSLAQSGPAWGGGVGLGNGIEAHVGRQQGGWLALGRVRYRWWGPADGPGSHFFDRMDTRSRQVEVAALAGYGLPLGRQLVYGAAGLGYLNGRALGEYRYATTESGVLGSTTYYYSYRSYQALGLPVEVGLLLPQLRGGQFRLGVAFQANFNPEKTLYCGMLTCWLGRFGSATR